MSKLTVGDCVIILGKPWASENNIRTAEDLLQPAPPEWAELAMQTHAAQKLKAQQILQSTSVLAKRIAASRKR